LTEKQEIELKEKKNAEKIPNWKLN
jgi:hypothetical protein